MDEGSITAVQRGPDRGRRALYLAVVAYIPLALGASALIVPAFVWFVRLGWNDTVFMLPLIYAGYQMPMAMRIIRGAASRARRRFSSPSDSDRTVASSPV